MPERFGPSPYNHEPSDVFTDPRAGTINYAYFQPYFDAVDLPVELARECVGEAYWSTPPGAGRKPRLDAARFIRLSALRDRDRLPPYREIEHELVPYGDIEDFAVAGPLSIWGGDNLLAKTPCVFVSHRWLTPEHPDPTGAHIGDLKRRFGEGGGWAAGDEVYLWIDYCCLPQRHGTIPLTPAERDLVRVALEQLPELVKSCELLILHSPDYLTRAWCYTELFVWLCKIAEIQGSSGAVPESHLVRAEYTREGLLKDTMAQFVAARGYEGARDDLLALHETVTGYYGEALDSANYSLGAYEHEYVPGLIGFMCTTWHALQRMETTEAADKRHCLRAIVNAVKM